MTCAEQQDKGTDVHGRHFGDCHRNQATIVRFFRYPIRGNPQLTETDSQRSWLVVAVTSPTQKRPFALLWFCHPCRQHSISSGGRTQRKRYTATYHQEDIWPSPEWITSGVTTLHNTVISHFTPEKNYLHRLRCSKSDISEPWNRLESGQVSFWINIGVL